MLHEQVALLEILPFATCHISHACGNPNGQNTICRLILPSFQFVAHCDDVVPSSFRYEMNFARSFSPWWLVPCSSWTHTIHIYILTAIDNHLYFVQSKAMFNRVLQRMRLLALQQWHRSWRGWWRDQVDPANGLMERKMKKNGDIPVSLVASFAPSSKTSSPDRSVRSLLVAMPGAPSSFSFLVEMAFLFLFFVNPFVVFLASPP